MKLTVSEINRKAINDTESFISQTEKRYQDEIRKIAREVALDKDKKIIMIAGPSGSGKTTTAHILCDYLAEYGKATEIVSLDDFYLNEPDVPRDEEGEPDFETVHSLDIPEIERGFKEIIEKGIYMMPVFDFATKSRTERKNEIDVRNGGILVVEGLHALNPLLTEHLPKENMLKVYISVNHSIYDDDMNLVLSSRQMRLVRRMSRNVLYRGATAQETYDMWESVIAGEQKYVYQFKSSADRVIATLHDYEPCIFKDNILKLLSEVNPESEDYDEYVSATIKGLKMFVSLPEDVVPHESLIREFIKGGKYE